MRLAAVLFALVVLGALPKPAFAFDGARLPELKPLEADYDIYVGGGHFMEAYFYFQQDKSRYSVTAQVQTRGIWNTLFPWKAHMISEGRVRGTRFEPLMHVNTATWKDDAKVIAMRFAGKRDVKVHFTPHEAPDKNREIVTAAQRRRSLDPLSVVLQLLGDLAVNQSCDGSEAAFDGKRRFDLISEDKGWGENDPQGYGVYKGPARRCDVYFKMIAGRWLDREHSLFWQYMDGDKGHEPFKIWLAALSPELPEMAVRAENASLWGRIVVHLKGWRYPPSGERKP